METKQSGFGIASLVLGIIGMVLSCVAIGIVPCIIGFVLAIIGLMKRDSKHGTAIAGLVCSVIGIAFFFLFLFVINIFDNDSSTVSSNTGQSYNMGTEIDKQGNTNYGTKTELADLMDVTEYSFENTIGDTLYFIVIENNSDETVEININAIAKDKDGKTIGATDSSENAVASGSEVCLCNYFDGVKNACGFEYTMTVKKDTFYSPVIQDIEVEESHTDEKVILTCTNNGDVAAQFVEAYALFFNDGELINYDSTYITDDDSEIKPGATISSELNCYCEYDDVKIYINGRK